MFKLDIQGLCETCLKKAGEAEILQCESCKFYFHAVCGSPDGKSDGIAKQTHLNLHKQRSTKKNFSWRCDRCHTVSEHTQAASVKDLISQLMERFTTFENQLPEKIRSIVNDEFQKCQETQKPDLDELSTNIASKITIPVKPPVAPWSDKTKVEQIKSSLLIKPDSEGNPVDENVINKVVVDNGVPVNKVVVTESGETYINLPDKKSRDKLCPLLQSEANEVVALKPKFPTISILDVKDNLSREQIKQGLCSQNEHIGRLVEEDNQELEVIYQKPPPQGKPYYKVSVRVSPMIRKCIANQNDRVYLSRKSCRIEDNYHIRRCNKCQLFGHYAEKCKAVSHTCGYCGENHDSNSCEKKDDPKRTHQCSNCRAAGLDIFEGHNTFDRECPAYKIQQDKLKNTISYLN